MGQPANESGTHTSVKCVYKFVSFLFILERFVSHPKWLSGKERKLPSDLFGNLMFFQRGKPTVSIVCNFKNA